ncbi:MAG: hypothetical protein EAZ91_06905 [Cytophagales bacterium]|nr:MAG: hypothetical protein EAZ91_06905 [Cytophagales bacterium]
MPHYFYTRHRPIFSTLALLTALFSSLINTSCRRKAADSIDPVVQADTLAPKITNMAIPGIPPENIKIDQVKRQLIVTVPASLTSLVITGGIWVQMTSGTRLNRFRMPVPWLSLCDGTFSNNSFEPVLPGKDPYDYHTLEVTDGERTKSYRLQLKPPGEMYFDTPNRTYLMKSDGTGETFKNLRVANYMDTSKSAKIVYNNIFTGEETVFDVPPCTIEGYMFPSSSVRNMTPGYYAISILKSNGRKTARSLAMMLTPGKPNFEGFLHPLNEGFYASVKGNSLYDGSLAGLDLEGVRNKVQYKLKINEYSRNGASMTVELPRTIMTGTYNARLVYKDGTRSDPKRSYIHKTSIQPQVGSIQGVFLPDSYADVRLRKGGPYYFLPQPRSEIARSYGLWVVLRPLINETQTYRFPVLITSGYVYIPSPVQWKDFASFTIPETVPNDKYQLRLEYRDASGSWQIGEWLDWHFVVE